MIRTALFFVVVAAPSFVTAGEATLYRDKWGVPHVFAEDFASAGYAVGQAQCEDSLVNVVNCLHTGVGRLSELAGPSGLNRDIEARTMRHAVYAEQAWPSLSPQLRELVEGFCAGVNRYLESHPDEYGTPVDAVTPVQVIAWHRSMLMRSTIKISKADAEASKSDGYDPDYNPDGVTGDDPVLRPAKNAHPGIPPGKSNSWAISGAKTASGAPILLIDPHFAVKGPMQLYELWLHVDDDLHAGGFCITGTPLPGLGMSEFAGWTFTSGGADSSDAYALKINPDNPYQYRFDDAWEDMDVRKETIRIRQDDGTFTEEHIEALETRHGPVLKTKGDVSFAAAMGGYRNGDKLEQFFRMATARTTAEFKAALALNRLSYFNIMWATTAGDIGYVQTGEAPLRPTGFNWSRMVPGWTSDTSYLRELTLAEHPTVDNPTTGFLQNCNTAANVVTTGLTFTREDFPPGVLWGHYAQYRARGARSTQLLSEIQNATLEDARDIAFDTYVQVAELWMPVILQAIEEWESSDADRPATDESKRLAEAAQLMKEWDRQATRDSAGATVFRFWRLACDDMKKPVMRDRFEIPNTADLRKTALTALQLAANRLHDQYGRVAVPWGEIKRLRRGDREWPLSGDGLGRRGMDTLRATAGDQFDADHKLILNGGQCVTSVVELTNPPAVRSVVAYGQSNKPDSPHYSDQAELYSDERLRAVPWTLDQVTSQLESETTFQFER